MWLEIPLRIEGTLILVVSLDACILLQFDSLFSSLDIMSLQHTG